jgi:hypothetical protein
METTNVAPSKTAAEIQQVLCDFGCSAVMVDYDSDRNPSAMSFVVNVKGRQQLSFRLPINVQPLFVLLQSKRKLAKDRADNADRDMEKARRIAWRQVLRWIQAQLAMVSVGMVKTEQVFMPYWVNNQGQTLYESIAGAGFKVLQLEHKP